MFNLILRVPERLKIDLTVNDKRIRPTEISFISEVSIFENKILVNQVKGIIMALSLKDSQKAEGKLKFIDAKGAETDAASVELKSSDENVATVSYDDPTNTVSVVAGQPGVAALSIVAKNSAGDVLPFDDVAIEVTAGDAKSGSIDFGEPTEQ